MQDNVSDCSVVAALIVAAEHHAKFGSKVHALASPVLFMTLILASQLALSCLHPQNASGLPVESPDGTYRARFLVNGAWRSVSTFRMLLRDLRSSLLPQVRECRRSSTSTFSA